MALAVSCSEPNTLSHIDHAGNNATEKPPPVEDGIGLIRVYLNQGNVMAALEVLAAFKQAYSENTVLKNIESEWGQAFAHEQSGIQVSPPLRVTDLDFATQMEWQLIERDYAALSGPASVEAARASVSILAKVNLLLERVPNFWDGRVLQAHLALGLGENASGRAAVSRIERWNSLGQYDAATIEAFRRRGWLQDTPVVNAPSVKAREGDYAAQLAALLNPQSGGSAATENVDQPLAEESYADQLAALLAQGTVENDTPDFEIEVQQRLSQIAAGAAQYMLNEGVDVVSYNALMSGGSYLNAADFTPLAGEDYRTVFPVRLDQPLSIVLPKTKQTVTFSY